MAALSAENAAVNSALEAKVAAEAVEAAEAALANAAACTAAAIFSQPSLVGGAGEL